MWRWSPELDWLVHMTCKSNGKVHNCLSERGQPPTPPPHPTWTLIQWCMATVELSRNLQISCLVPGVWSMRLWVLLLTPTHHIAGSGRGQDEANPVFWLAFWAGKMGLSCPLGISRFGPTRKVLLDIRSRLLDRYGPINYLLNIRVISFLDQDGWIAASFLFSLRFYQPRFRTRESSLLFRLGP